MIRAPRTIAQPPRRTAQETIDAILASPGASYWLKDALRLALIRDPNDAARDAEILAFALRDRANSLTGKL